MNLLSWIVLGLLIWAAVAVAAAVVVIRVIRERDRQIPSDDEGPR